MDNRNTPKPSPSKMVVKPRPRNAKKKLPPMRDWNILLPTGGTYTIKARSEVDALKKVSARSNVIPTSITPVKRKFERPDRLTDRPFRNLEKMIKEGN